MIGFRQFLLATVGISGLFMPAIIHAATPEADIRKAMLEMADESADTRKAAIALLSKCGDMRVATFFNDFNSGNVYFWKAKSEILVSEDPKKGTPLLDPLTRQPLAATPVGTPEIADQLTNLSPTRLERNKLKDVLNVMALYSASPDERIAAIVKSGTYGMVDNLPILIELQKTDKDPRVVFAAEESIALLQLISADGTKWTPEQLAAINKIGALSSSRALERLKELKTKNDAASKDAEAEKDLSGAIKGIEMRLYVARGIGHVFSGLSLGSVLILMALGLSIIFGLMGVINMAHGELMMIGAYATLGTQLAFGWGIEKHWIPASAFDNFFIVSIPLSFIAAAIVGYLMEVLVIRHLYKRPLDSLLATWGISLILTQAVRLQFGDNNGVNSPTWLQGSFEIMQDVNLPYNRLFIILFCGLCIALMFLIINKTKMGLLLRATTQNRNMAASLGVPTRRIDGMTFALGAGLAGMAGCALTQIGGVTPDMGGNYIVDSFLVVVTGGVGKLAGAIWAGLGLGMFNKFFEAFSGAVWGKVFILIGVVIFLQWRPSGLFPAKGRTADV